MASTTSTKTVAIHQDVPDSCYTRYVWNIVKIASGVGELLIDSWRYALMLQRKTCRGFARKNLVAAKGSPIMDFIDEIGILYA